jgi:hypothetical protein
MTKTAIIALLARNDLAVERAMVALYQRQTADEQHTSTTSHSNGRGFNYYHAERGTYYAKWVLSGRHLTGHHLAAARKMATYYARQLSEIAEDKKQASEALALAMIQADGMVVLDRLDQVGIM